MNEQMNDRVDVAFVVHVKSFSHVFGCFSDFQEEPNVPKGLVQPVEQKLRHPFSSKLKKLIVFARNLG